ncbi:MAG: hypothetical protein COV35_02800 [Alphaproteobacteria bacterium CG11_big_fil_rev_8_21_14_0_20_39_49]|nr:MAG: hypothetical protein COV35_02800 [Alphaproteobacteria bacterium CG11_big_fil_rev_8_21_14_0_20_39_49]
MKVAYSFFVLVMIALACILSVIHYNRNNPEVAVYTPMAMESVASEQTVKKSDISDILSKADNEYISDNTFKSVDKLNEAIAYIRQKQSEDLKEFLPKEVAGWELRTEVVEPEEEEYISGQAVASQEFVSDDKLIKISIVVGSKLNNEIYELATLNDNSGGVGEYNGYITKFYRSPQNNKLVIAVGKDAVLEVEGFKLSHSDALKIADSVNLADILSYTNK